MDNSKKANSKFNITVKQQNRQMGLRRSYIQKD